MRGLLPASQKGEPPFWAECSLSLAVLWEMKRKTIKGPPDRCEMIKKNRHRASSRVAAALPLWGLNWKLTDKPVSPATRPIPPAPPKKHPSCSLHAQVHVRLTSGWRPQKGRTSITLATTASKDLRTGSSTIFFTY